MAGAQKYLRGPRLPPPVGLNEDLFHALNGAGNGVLDPVMVAFGVLGLSVVCLLWAAPLWFAKRRREAVDLVVLLAFAEVLVFVLKVLVASPRPFLDPAVHARVLPVPFDSTGDWSFPSGHATRAFAVAALLTLRTKDWRWGVPLFAYAVVMALSRVYVGVHWPSDVLAGALIGLALAYGFHEAARIPAYADRRDAFVAWLTRVSRPS